MPQPTTMKICIGETAPGSNPFNAPQQGVTCSENSVKSAPGGAEFHAVCNAQGMTVTSDGKVSGDMRTAYKVDITTKTTGPQRPAGHGRDEDDHRRQTLGRLPGRHGAEHHRPVTDTAGAAVSSPRRFTIFAAPRLRPSQTRARTGP